MSSLKRRYGVAFFLLLITGMVVMPLQYQRGKGGGDGANYLQEIPMTVGYWQGRDLPLDTKVYEILETQNIIHRQYTSPNGGAILLSIVYYQDTKVDFHAPEACLGGRGERTKKSKKDIVFSDGAEERRIELAELVSKGPGGVLLSYYFYMTEGFWGQNYVQLRLQLAKNKLCRADASGSLIRVSTGVLEAEEQSVDLLISFLTELIPVIEAGQ